jgi:hypothetical protein
MRGRTQVLVEALTGFFTDPTTADDDAGEH